ncbi:MAG: DUF4384 domain-containing protein [Endomicrobiales bacterium]|nr:DUF4384 domain-containing protein [Endomicrobiales bacterium]
MNKYILTAIIAVSVFFITIRQSEAWVLFDSLKEPPEWLQKSIITKDKYIYAVGHSGMLTSKDDAKNEAVSNAIEVFAKHCKVDINSFDRSIEIYSKKDGIEFAKGDAKTRSSLRADAFFTKTSPDDWYIKSENDKFKASVLLKIPIEEFKRITEDKNRELSIDFLLYFENEKGNRLHINEGDGIELGNHFAIYTKPSDICYLYIYSVNSSGEALRRFPNADYYTSSNPVKQALDNWVPNTKDLFILKNTKGREYFYIFASQNPIYKLEGIGAKNLTKRELDNLIKINKINQAQLKDKRDMEKMLAPKHIWQVVNIEKKLQGKSTFVYTTWIEIK